MKLFLLAAFVFAVALARTESPQPTTEAGTTEGAEDTTEAPAEPVEEKIAVADMREFGSFTFHQKTDGQLCITAMLNGLNNDGGGYHVHETPASMWYSMGGEIDAFGCDSDITGGHYDTGFSEDGPSNDGKTNIMMSAGAVDLRSQSEVDEEWCFQPPRASLYDDIVGRSVVVHKANGDRWFCGTIVEQAPQLPEDALLLWAKFGDFGNFKFLYNPEAEDGTFCIHAQLEGLGGNAFGYHVHQTAAGATNMDCGPGQTGGHYYTGFSEDGMGNNGMTNIMLSPGAVDLTGKNDTADVDPWCFDPPINSLYADINGRSVVVHNDNSDRWFCGTIELLVPDKTAVADMGDHGSFVFHRKEDNELCIYADLKGLDGDAGGYHVHQTAGTGMECGADITGGHYDTGFSEDGPANDGKTNIMMSPGAADLTGKSSISQEWCFEQPRPALYNDILTRSVVVHKANGDRWFCGTIEEGPTNAPTEGPTGESCAVGVESTGCDDCEHYFFESMGGVCACVSTLDGMDGERCTLDDDSESGALPAAIPSFFLFSIAMAFIRML